ncbi:hypothetical protein LTR78_001251 [Recurvomyces mirabilis]|uniref:Uncharacterized protein n=1 Tax=Recurvomyces mirabilis TaxID=574656 RepID=A0AAE0WVN7_9PEZI|nr:hypothetical protein LTR78_001251 [Recurvomyces mirabilis]KAK5161227.1 hypothetical protein LTS14_001023 [Recurvomyces mirabilis]
MFGDESDYGSSFEETTVDVSIDERANELDQVAAGSRPQTVTLHHNHSSQDTNYGSDVDPAIVDPEVVDISDGNDETDYGSDDGLVVAEHEVITISDDDSESDYGSDIDHATAEQLYGIASISQPSCALLQLPPELRDLFYEKAFEDFTAEWTTGQWFKPPGILFSCKQIFSEAINIFYNTATFQTCSYNMLERRLLRLRYQHRRLVSKIQLDSASQGVLSNESTLRSTFVALVAHGALHKPHHIKSAQQAEDDVAKVRALLGKNRNLREVRLVKLEASVKDLHGGIIWTEDPTSVLIRFVAEEIKRHDEL